jgi:hypothetical protein
MRNWIAIFSLFVSTVAYGQCPGGRCPLPQRPQEMYLQQAPARIISSRVVSAPVSVSSVSVSSIPAVSSCPCNCSNCICNSRTVSPVPSCSYSVSPTPSCRYYVSPISRGHWTYPGTISYHLRNKHGVNVAGMSREQMLNFHDALHEAAR